jgi:hypothetical protein
MAENGGVPRRRFAGARSHGKAGGGGRELSERLVVFGGPAQLRGRESHFALHYHGLCLSDSGFSLPELNFTVGGPLLSRR